MKLLFCLFNYFPHGGLQKDCLSIAKLCVARGHQVCILTGKWQGERPKELQVELLPVRALTNIGVVKKYIDKAQRYFNTHQYDLIIGFNRIPGVDVYYAADPCYKEIYLSLPWYKKIYPRYLAYLNIEKQLCAPKNTHFFMQTPQAQAQFAAHYQLKPEVMHLIPLGIDNTRYALTDYNEAQQQQLKQQHGLSVQDKLVIFIGSSFKTKGLTRALLALASLPEQMQQSLAFWVIGADDAKPYQTLVKNLQCQVKFLGGRDDIHELLRAADLLLHPALLENGGHVLLEAMASATPILTTDICGYAQYVVQAQGGHVVPSPFKQDYLNHLLLSMLSENLLKMRNNGIHFCQQQTQSCHKESIVKVFEELALINWEKI